VPRVDRVAEVAEVGDRAIERLEGFAQRGEAHCELRVVLGGLGEMQQEARRAEQSLEVVRDHAQQERQHSVVGLAFAH